MSKSTLTTFLESFDDNKKRRGTQWEYVCKWFLETDPVYRGQLKKVWLWDKWPGRWGEDAGNDLVAKTKDGKLWAIQAKHYAPDNTVTKIESPAHHSSWARSSDMSLIVSSVGFLRFRLLISK